MKFKAVLRTEYDKLGCADNSCLFKKPSGMATNGGCRCIDLHTHTVRRILQLTKRWLDSTED